MGISIQGRTGWASIPNNIGRSRLPHPTVHLLLNLLTHSEGFDAGYSLITNQTGMAPATISTALDNLKKLDLISVKKVAGKNGRFASNHYIFHADLLWKLSPEFVDERLRKKTTATGNESGDDGTASGAEVGTASGNEAAPLQELKRKNDHGELPVENDQPPLPPTGGVDDGHSIDDEFTEWYQLYPRKKSKADALKAFKASRKKVSLETLIHGIESSKAQWMREGRDSSKIPYPATWLRSESWADGDDDWIAPVMISPNGSVPDGFRKLNSSERRMMETLSLMDSPDPRVLESLRTGLVPINGIPGPQAATQAPISPTSQHILEMEMH